MCESATHIYEGITTSQAHAYCTVSHQIRFTGFTLQVKSRHRITSLKQSQLNRFLLRFVSLFWLTALSPSGCVLASITILEGFCFPVGFWQMLQTKCNVPNKHSHNSVCRVTDVEMQYGKEMTATPITACSVVKTKPESKHHKINIILYWHMRLKPWSFLHKVHIAADMLKSVDKSGAPVLSSDRRH